MPGIEVGDFRNIMLNFNDINGFNYLNNAKEEKKNVSVIYDEVNKPEVITHVCFHQKVTLLQECTNKGIPDNCCQF